MVPSRLARKMSVLSVEPLALGGPGEIGAERAHRPGSRRLGGVEATGASVATADSSPDRRKGWTSPEWGPALRSAVMVDQAYVSTSREGSSRKGPLSAEVLARRVCASGPVREHSYSDQQKPAIRPGQQTGGYISERSSRRRCRLVAPDLVDGGCSLRHSR